MSQSQVAQGVVTMGVQPIIVRPRFGISSAAVVHIGGVGFSDEITIVGQPA